MRRRGIQYLRAFKIIVTALVSLEFAFIEYMRRSAAKRDGEDAWLAEIGFTVMEAVHIASIFAMWR